MSGCTLALILLLDSSGSVEPGDWRRQVEGHARAFESEEVAHVIEREGSVGGTMTAAALEDAQRAMTTAPCEPERQIVDLVTDGPANDHVRVPAVRDGLAEAGIRLNALFVETAIGRREAHGRGYEDGLEWLRAEVVTPGGMALAAEGWGDFERAIRRKIVLEVAGR